MTDIPLTQFYVFVYTGCRTYFRKFYRNANEKSSFYHLVHFCLLQCDLVFRRKCNKHKNMKHHHRCKNNKIRKLVGKTFLLFEKM